ncbi:MAG: response regulator transcription factor [Burkholderiales bacterium]|nr:response regulator transcription factor [Anaerolineae bacterium]
MKVLVVDNDVVLADVVGFTLRRSGFEVITAHNGQNGLERWQVEAPDLVLLEILLPNRDGLTLFERLREQRNTPIIILSAQDSDEDVVRGLEMGADDYIAKPFSPAQLVARVRAVLRRTAAAPRGGVVPDGLLTYGDLTFDLARRMVLRASQPRGVQLTPLESRLLKALIVNGGQVLPNETLVSSVWGIDGGDRVMLKQLVHRLRQKIEPAPTNPIYIETVPGVGYALNAKQ